MNVTPATSYRCGKCKRIYLDEKVAENCCAPTEALCQHCGKPVEDSRYRLFHYHDECRTKHLLDKAEETQIQEGFPVYDPYQETFYADLGELVDYYDDAAEPLPEFCFASKERKWKGIDLNRAIDQAREDFSNEGDDYPDLKDFIDLSEAEEFIEKWNAKQTILVFDVDWKRKIKLR